MLRTLIAEDDYDLSDALADFLEMQEEIDVCGRVYDGYAALEAVRMLSPDLVLLDNIMPRLDGIGVLEAMHACALPKMPKVILFSAMQSEALMSSLQKFRVDYYMMKPFDPDVLLRRIREISADVPRAHGGCHVRVASEHRVLAASEYHTGMAPEHRDRIVSLALRDIGVPPHLKGYGYLRKAIGMSLDRPLCMGMMTKELYPEIAAAFSTTPVRVERAIRNAIEVTWSRGRIDTLQRTFGYTIDDNKGKPTNAEFIAMLADQIRHDAYITV